MRDIEQQLLDNILSIVDELQSKDDVYEWIEEQLNIEKYSINTDMSFRGGEVLISFGGPTIWISTEDNTVYGVWGSDYINRTYEDNIGIHEYLQEIYEQTKG